MFDNIGEKIKKLANTICWIGIIGSFIAGIAYFVILANANKPGMGFLVLLLIGAGGSLLSWIGSFATYALGELVDNSSKILAEQKKAGKNLFKMTTILENIYDDETSKNQENNSIGKCTICGKDGVPVDKVEIIEYEDGMDRHRHCFVCKDCQKKYKDQ